DVAARVSNTIEQGHTRFETCHRCKDGRLMDIEASATYMPEAKQFFVFCHDITGRKQSEKELRIAAATFETHEAIVITNVDAQIVRVNRAFSEITGYSAEEVLGKNPNIMNSGRHDRNFYVEMWQGILNDGAWAGEIWDRRKNGEVYPKWMTITAVKNEQHVASHNVAIFSDITARKRIEEEIHSLAFYDSLTKLPNRRLFLDRFRSALLASARRDDYGAVLFIDLDRFKALNDNFGHDYGDLLLIEVGVRIKSCVREMDTVARFGGDEFVVLIGAFSKSLDDVTHQVALLAEKIREALSRPYDLKGHEHYSSPSIGISLYHGNDETIESLIEHADMAMYQAKNSGRNAVRFFDPVMQQNVATHDALENDLYHAIELQQLHLHYQIQVDQDKQPMGAEAFLRWEHPNLGMILPGQFLPIAEESNLIIEISRWVLKMACEQLAKWSADDKMRDLTMTINISSKQFALPDFVGEVADIIKQHNVDPTRLKMELSEQLLLSEVNNTMEKVHALKNMGVKMTMDNFNTMYSSLSFIRELSSDQLKIHQAFVQGISEEGNDAKLVQTIIDLAKSMDMNIFAEGVETEEQRTFLKDHDCNTYQGYLFGKPVSIEQFEDVINRL
ncbi:MAG: EAL domain-containing protein, partial [Gallionellaceae bacterium]